MWKNQKQGFHRCLRVPQGVKSRQEVFGCEREIQERLTARRIFGYFGIHVFENEVYQILYLKTAMHL